MGYFKGRRLLIDRVLLCTPFMRTLATLLSLLLSEHGGTPFVDRDTAQKTGHRPQYGLGTVV